MGINMKLVEQSCEVCRAGAPQVTTDELAVYLDQLTGWQVEERGGIKQLEKRYEFGNFVDALAFTNRVGGLAESVGHHPMLITEWGGVTVIWWTHKIQGLHKNDFIMAAKTDHILDL